MQRFAKKLSASSRFGPANLVCTLTTCLSSCVHSRLAVVSVHTGSSNKKATYAAHHHVSNYQASKHCSFALEERCRCVESLAELMAAALVVVSLFSLSWSRLYLLQVNHAAWSVLHRAPGEHPHHLSCRRRRPIPPRTKDDLAPTRELARSPV
jgi:hypothetical protein